jgi:hypothetical protein
MSNKQPTIREILKQDIEDALSVETVAYPHGQCERYHLALDYNPDAEQPDDLFPRVRVTEIERDQVVYPGDAHVRVGMDSETVDSRREAIIDAITELRGIDEADAERIFCDELDGDITQDDKLSARADELEAEYDANAYAAYVDENMDDWTDDILEQLNLDDKADLTFDEFRREREAAANNESAADFARQAAAEIPDGSADTGQDHRKRSCLELGD